MRNGDLAEYNRYVSGEVKLRDIPLDSLSRWILLRAHEKEPEVFIQVVVELYEMDKLISLGLDIRKCLNSVDDSYKTQDIYLRLFKVNPLKIFRLIPDKFLTQEICDEYFRINPNANFLYIPHQFRTKEMYQEVYKDSPISYFNHLPDKYKTQEECDYYALKYLKECFYSIPDRYKTQDMCDRYFKIDSSVEAVKLIPERFRTKEMWKKYIFWTYDMRSMARIPKEIFDEDLSDFLFDKFGAEALKYIPDEYKSQEMWMIMLMYYEDDINIMKRIPKKHLNQNMFNIFFNKYSSKGFHHIPGEFRTKEMYIVLLQEDIVKYLNQVPLEYYDEEILSVIVFELKKVMKNKKVINIDLDKSLKIVSLYPALIKAFSREIRYEIIERELYSLIDNSGSLRMISKKYDITVAGIQDILENMKDKDLNSYMMIKKVLEANENRYLVGMIEDVTNLGKIISLLGDLKGNFLSSSQKVIFAYLYNKHIYHSLEEIYDFNRRYFLENPDMANNLGAIQNAKKISFFFRRFLKFNQVFDRENYLENMPEIKTILFNNSWLKKYDKDKFFAIKDGKPTLEHRYGKESRLLTMEIERYVVDRLKIYGIPLNDYIVQMAFKEYFSGNLDEYIARFQEYDLSFEVQDKSRKGKK